MADLAGGDMIKIKQIHIEEFRGIRKLTLDLDGKSFGICGSNGTGKSGVVDAIEFGLTGTLTRLTGEGQGELSVGKHAPHVDLRAEPEKSKVTITAHIPSLGRDVVLTRNVKAPKQLVVTPAGGPEEATIRALQAHPEFALSRREIAKYIITPPARRSAEVQNLLKLEQIGRLRKAFGTFARSAERNARDAASAKTRAERDLTAVVNGGKLSRDLLLTTINTYRKVLDQADLLSLAADTVFNDIAATQPKTETTVTVARNLALAEIASFKTELLGTPPIEWTDAVSEGEDVLRELSEDAEALVLARRHGLISTGLEILCEEACPLCDRPWDKEELRAHLQQKLLNAAAVGQLLMRLHNKLGVIEGAIDYRLDEMRKLHGYGIKLSKDLNLSGFVTYAEALKGFKALSKEFAAAPEDPAALFLALSELEWKPPSTVFGGIEAIETLVKALPEASVREAAVLALAVAQERYGKLVEAARLEKEANKRKTVAQKVDHHYGVTSTEVLEGIYEAVAAEFTEFYKILNDDEGKFIGELKAEPTKLSFEVDFYGRGVFPPGAYHSEGHQDGMGLCLYLALMRHTLGERFTFAVLDDVLMSVDTGHRREVCRLLRIKFPDTQFILTTHDRVWLQFMKTEKLIEKTQMFGGWSAEVGPRIWDDQDIWPEIEGQLEKGDVPRAAWLLRRYLEYICHVLADNLRAQVHFRADGNYGLEDLLPAVQRQYQNRLEKGVRAATAWGHDAEKSKLFEKKELNRQLAAATATERWAINPAVHFNEWENLDSGEFRKVASAYRAYFEEMRCRNPMCGSLPYLYPAQASADQLRCHCQEINVNLKDKT